MPKKNKLPSKFEAIPEDFIFLDKKKSKEEKNDERRT